MKKRPLVGMFVVVVLGIFLLELGGGLKKPPLPFKDGEKITLTGTIRDLSQKETSQEIYLSNIYLSSLPSYQGQVLVYENQNVNLKIGNQIKVTGEFQALQRAANPGQFDQKNYYEARKIGFVLTKANVEIRSFKVDWFSQGLLSLRSYFQWILKETAGEEKAALFSAMILGEKGELQKEQKDLYQSGGISHILAISGLHISLVGMALYRLLRKCGQRYFVSVLLSGSFMVIYGCFVGFGVSAKRAIWMFLIFLGAELFGRSYDLLSSLSLAGILILLEEPLLLFDCGFQLSFLSVAAVGGVYPSFQKSLKKPGKWKENLLLGVCVAVVTLPCMLYWFFEWTPYSLLLNLLVIPLVPIVFLFGALGMVVGSFHLAFGAFFAGPGIGVLLFFDGLLEAAQNLPFSRLVLGRPSESSIVCYYVCLLTGLFWKKEWLGNKRAVQGFLFLAGVFLLFFQKPGWGETTFLDVGQGDCIFLQTKSGRTCLIDGGSTTESKVGTYRILPFLKARGVRNVDYLFLTHMDADHVNGAAELLADQKQGVRIRHLCLGEAFGEDEQREEIVQLAKKAGTEILIISRGTGFAEKDFSITCLSPPKGGSGKDKNENSLVLLVRMDDISMLFTGDLEGKAEEELILQNLISETDVLKVAHHGAKGATSEEFLEKVNPKLSLISCGAGNRYGHPSPELLKRLLKINTRIYDTRTSGAVSLYVKGSSLKVEEFCPKPLP